MITTPALTALRKAVAGGDRFTAANQDPAFCRPMTTPPPTSGSAAPLPTAQCSEQGSSQPRGQGGPLREFPQGGIVFFRRPNGCSQP